jgi:hypothetical protein
VAPWEHPEVIPDSALVVFARDDDYFFGVVQSRPVCTKSGREEKDPQARTLKMGHHAWASEINRVGVRVITVLQTAYV